MKILLKLVRVQNNQALRGKSSAATGGLGSGIHFVESVGEVGSGPEPTSPTLRRPLAVWDARFNQSLHAAIFSPHVRATVSAGALHGNFMATAPKV